MMGHDHEARMALAPEVAEYVAMALANVLMDATEMVALSAEGAVLQTWPVTVERVSDTTVCMTPDRFDHRPSGTHVPKVERFTLYDREHRALVSYYPDPAGIYMAGDNYTLTVDNPMAIRHQEGNPW